MAYVSSLESAAAQTLKNQIKSGEVYGPFRPSSVHYNDFTVLPRQTSQPLRVTVTKKQWSLSDILYTAAVGLIALKDL